MQGSRVQSLTDVDACAHELRDALLALAANRDEICERIAETIALEIPEIAGDAGLLAGSRTSTFAAVDAFVALVLNGQDPATARPPEASLRLARDFVHSGIPFTTLLRKYRVGQAAFSRLLLDQLGAQIEDRARFEEAVRRANDLLFAYVDQIADGIVEEYLSERDRWSEGSQLATVQAILGGRLDDEQLATRRLGHHFDCDQLAFVVSSDAGGDRALLERIAAEVASALGCSRVLLIPAARDGVFGWLSSFDPFCLERLASSPVCELLNAAGAHLAFGEPGGGLEGFRRSHAQAVRAAHTAQLLGKPVGSMTTYGAVALSALVLADGEAAREFALRELGALATDDDATRRIAATLRIYLEEASSPVRTARRLGVHANTVAYRVRRAEQLRGRPLGERMLELQVALSLVKALP